MISKIVSLHQISLFLVVSEQVLSRSRRITYNIKSKNSSVATQRLAKNFTRRSIVKNAFAVGIVAATGPFYVKDAFSSSGRVNIFIWDGYLPKPFIDGFTKQTGIKVKVTSLNSNETLLNKIKSTKGRGFDVIAPTLNRALQWKDLGLLLPWDLNKVPIDHVDPRQFNVGKDQWTWDGGLHFLPHIWGTEAIGYRTDLFETEYGKLSFGNLWRPEVKGKVMGRPHSLMAGIGRYLEAKGELPPFIDAYKDEDNMRRHWDAITKFAIEHKPWVKQFWNSADELRSGFIQNGVVLGQTWDGPVIELKNAGKPVNYMAPVEGAFAWLDGLAMPIGAKNKDEAYELIKACYTPKWAGLQASMSGYNSTVIGADKYLTLAAKTAFQDAYPDDAVDKLWWWPGEPQWYADVRAEYRDKFVAA